MKDIYYEKLKKDLLAIYNEIEIKSKQMLPENSNKKLSTDEVFKIKQDLIELQCKRTADAIEKYIDGKMLQALQTKQTLK